jgi:competence protein ComEC
LRNFPVIKITLFFIIGISVQKFSPLKPEGLFLLVISAFLISAVLFFIAKKKQAASLFVMLSFVLAGSLVYSIYLSGLKPYPFEKLKYNNCNIYGSVKSIELIKEGRIVFNAGIDSVIISSIRYKMNHEFIVRLYDENRTALIKVYEELQIGDNFQLKGSIQQARDKRNPGEFDYNNYLYHNNISGLVSAYSADAIILLKRGPGSSAEAAANLFHQMRKGIDYKIQELHSKKASALLRGLLLGDYKKIDEESLENFMNAGVVHVLAVSGQHVALILMIFFFMFNRFNPYLKYIFAVIGLIFFLFITGSQVSVARAVIMGLVFIAATLLNRDKNMYNVLALSALVILLFNPDELFSAGFQLSYSAVLSIVYLYPVLRDWINPYILKHKILKTIILFSLVSIAAQIGTLPFTLAYFHKLSIAAIFANLFVIPLSGGIIYGGIITLVTGLFWPWGAAIFAASDSTLCWFTALAVNFFGSRGYSFLLVNQFSFYDAFIYYAGLMLIIYIVKNFKKKSIKAVAILFTVITMFLFMVLDNYSIAVKNQLTVLAVDVGQGDATLIQFPDGKTGLIDAGNAFKNFSNGDKVILPLMNRMDIGYIDYAFITHLDADHYYGIFKLIEKGKIKTVYKPLPDSSNKADLDFEKYLKRNNCKVNYFSDKLLPIGGCRLYFLNHPSLSERVKAGTNSKSMILKMIYGNSSFLFTGDADKEIEDKLVTAAGNFLKTDMLKAGHHGSKNSSADRFIEAVKPEFVIISAGIENRFHHPSPEVVEKFNKINANVKRTDKNGAVLLNSDGYKITIIDWKKKETRFIFDL